MERSLTIILTSLSTILDKRFIKKLKVIIEAILSMQGRITMLGIYRWNNEYSYKTIERFFDEKINWLSIKWAIVKELIDEEVIMVADETIATKSGECTSGIGYFFSSLANRPVKSISFLVFSIVSVKQKRSFPIYTKQIRKLKAEKKVKKAKSKKVGRPKGSKNRNRRDIRLNGLFRMVNLCLGIILKTVKIANLKHFVYDGAFGNNAGIQSILRRGLHLISKLKRNSALYFEFEGVRKGRGPKKKYGAKVEYNNIDEKYLVQTKIEKDKEIKIYQFKAYHKTIADLLNIVVICAYDLKSGKQDHKILFSTDHELGFEKIIEYYSLRFQIEFNFRDSKQFFGLEDFMNIKKRRIHNFANLSIFMNNVAYSFAQKEGLKTGSINDIKSIFMAEKYTREVLKLSSKNIDDDFILKIANQVALFASINQNSA